MLYCDYIQSQENVTIHLLSEFCSYSTQKTDNSRLSLDEYVTTDNLLPDKKGITLAKNLPSTGAVTCNRGDVLISNIRPYLKKIYYCQTTMGCSTDVLCIRPIPEMSEYIYCCLYHNAFFDYMMSGSKGTKMPRGDKNQIMQYPIAVPSQYRLSEFNNLARNSLRTIGNNELENRKLMRIRDCLLPLLMSGQATIAD